MKKFAIFAALAVLLAMLTGCTAVEDALGKVGDDMEAAMLDTPESKDESIDWAFVPVVREMASTLFTESFPEAKITNSAVASRSGRSDHVIVVLDFEMGEKSGSYGFEYEKNDAGEYELKRYGEGVTSDDL